MGLKEEEEWDQEWVQWEDNQALSKCQALQELRQQQLNHNPAQQPELVLQQLEHQLLLLLQQQELKVQEWVLGQILEQVLIWVVCLDKIH